MKSENHIKGFSFFLISSCFLGLRWGGGLLEETWNGGKAVNLGMDACILQGRCISVHAM